MPTIDPTQTADQAGHVCSTAELGERCPACAGTGEDFNEGDPCNVCGGTGDHRNPGPMAGRSHAMEYLRQTVASDMAAFYRAFQGADADSKTPN